jgi:hypothetical protein
MKHVGNDGGTVEEVVVTTFGANVALEIKNDFGGSTIKHLPQ